MSSSAGVTPPSESDHSDHSTPPSGTDSNGPTEAPEENDDSPAARRTPPPLAVPSAPVIEAPTPKVEEARTATPVVIDVVNPPPPPPTAPKIDIYAQVNNVIQHNTNVVVNNTVVANHWNYLEYDDYHQPTFYNPYTDPFTVRYFYGGAYHEIWVPIGGRIVIPVPVVGIFPFTVVSANHVWAGDFCGGSYIAPVGWVGPPPPSWRPPPPPVVYTNHTVRVVSANRVVRVNSVKVAGRDETKPVGQRDTFMVNDTTLAWGETKPDGSIDIAATQTLPGVGPVDDGSSLINTALAAHEEDNSTLWVLGGGLAVLVAAAIAVVGRTWRRAKPAFADDVADTTPIAWSREKR